MFRHQHEDSIGYAGGNIPMSGQMNNDIANGDVVRRQVRTGAAGQQPMQLKIPTNPQQQIFWLHPRQSYQSSMSNGFAHHAMTPADDTLRPVSVVGDHSIAMQAFNASIAQRAGIAANPPQPPLLSTPLHSNPHPSEIGRASVSVVNGHAMERVPQPEMPMEEPRSLDELAEFRRVGAYLAGTVGIAVGASVIVILTFQLLLNLNYYESPTLSGIQLVEGSVPQILRDLSTALCTASMTCSLCAVMTSFLHFYFCCRIIDHATGVAVWKERIERYRQRTVYIRALSNGGFFVGIIIFMLAMITYQQLLNTAFGSMISSTIVTAIIGIGAMFCTIALGVGFYFAGICQEIRLPSRSIKDRASEKRGTLV